jgi:hypothetical protein
MSVIARALIYFLAGVPGAIGVAFVARYAYVTSDTAIDGASTAFLYGMIALAAYGGPAAVIAVWANGWRVASCVLAIVVAATMVANISQTLGAIANRNAGGEADRAKAEDQIGRDRSRLAQVDAELKLLPLATITAEAVSSARAAVAVAERSREVECASGRGTRCQQAERDEASKRDALIRLTEGLGASETRAKLSAEGAALRARLQSAPAVREKDPLAKTLAELLSIPEEKAGKLQHGALAVIFELVVAAILALPELLKPRGKAARPEDAPQAQPPAPLPAVISEVVEEPQPQRLAILPPPKPKIATSSEQTAGAVGDILADIIEPAPRQRLEIEDAYLGYAAECKRRGSIPLPPEQFVEALHRFAVACAIPTKMLRGQVYLDGVGLANAEPRSKQRRLGKMAG